MKAIGLARIGRDAELRYLTSGDAVVNIALAFSYGKKGADGNRPTQWVEAALFGKRAETLAPYLLKGASVVAYLSDLHIETYEGRNGTGTKLAARVDDIELAGKKDASAPPSAPAAPPARRAPPPAAPAATSGFDDMDDDIPF